VKVDDADFDALSTYRWSALRSRYAQRHASADEIRNGSPHKVLMHRQIIKVTDGLEVDHVNGDGLDNRRSNLRVASRAENTRNNPGWGGRSLPKGVKVNGRGFSARVMRGGRQYHLGTFQSIPGAALAYAWAAGILHGEFYRP
jgi:hypothetical protein